MSNRKNHRRDNREKVSERYNQKDYHNGYAKDTEQLLTDFLDPENKQYYKSGTRGFRTGMSGYLDKSMHGWGNIDTFSDKIIGASIGNDFTNGHRGMTKAVAGAKKFVRSRTRFHGKMKVHKIMIGDHD